MIDVVMLTSVVTLWTAAVGIIIRNSWVYRTRLCWIYHDLYSYEHVVSYGTMMLRWWNWSRNAKDWQS